MANRGVGTLLVLGADGDLTQRLLLPGLTSLLASEWAPGRSLLLVGAGLGDLDDRAWARRLEDSFGSAGVRARRVTDTARRSCYRQCDVTSVCLPR